MGDDGRVLLHDFGSCANEVVVAALGATMADLFPPKNGTAGPARPAKPRRPQSPERRWTVHDVDGKAWTHHRDDAHVPPVWWDAGVKLAQLLPYLSEATGPDPVYLVEGEPAADALRAFKLSAMATLGTSYRPVRGALAPLTGRDVILWPDADADPKKGRAHMLDMAERLAAIASGVRWIEPPPDVFDGWDAADADETTVRRLIATAGPLPSTIGTGVVPMHTVDSSPPPDPYVSEFMATYEATVLYGAGGSTKGTVTAWIALRAVRDHADAAVYVLDYEHHESEWGGRLRRLGATDDELGRIHYASPYAQEWTAPKGPLSAVLSYVTSDCDRLGVTLLVVDSMTTAAGTGEALGGMAAATEYFDALNRIGRRSWTLAHVTGNAEKWPARPFGSVHIHNLARETWAIALTAGGNDEVDSHGLTYATAELRCRKANGRRRPKAQVVTFTYEPDYGPITVTEAEKQINHGDLVHDALSKTPTEWLTAKAIVAAVKADTTDVLTEAQVYDAIRRDRKGRFDSDETARPFKYRCKS